MTVIILPDSVVFVKKGKVALIRKSQVSLAHACIRCSGLHDDETVQCIPEVVVDVEALTSCPQSQVLPQQNRNTLAVRFYPADERCEQFGLFQSRGINRASSLRSSMSSGGHLALHLMLQLRVHAIAAQVGEHQRTR